MVDLLVATKHILLGLWKLRMSGKPLPQTPPPASISIGNPAQCLGQQVPRKLCGPSAQSSVASSLASLPFGPEWAKAREITHQAGRPHELRIEVPIADLPQAIPTKHTNELYIFPTPSFTIRARIERDGRPLKLRLGNITIAEVVKHLSPKPDAYAVMKSLVWDVETRIWEPSVKIATMAKNFGGVNHVELTIL